MRIFEICVEQETLDDLYRDGEAYVLKPKHLHINSYCILRSAQATAHCRFITSSRVKLSAKDKALTFNKISPRDAAQKAFLDSLADPKMLLTVGQGRAGSGKTLLTMAWAFDAVFRNQYSRLVLTKPNTVVGSTFGFGPVPGDLKEKFDPFLASYEDTFKDLGITKIYLEQMADKGTLEFRPIQYLRGTNLKNSIIVIDECQNTSWHELKTILSRAAEGSKVIAIGDPSQIDTKTKAENTGYGVLTQSHAFDIASYCSWITFEKQYRTALCELVEDIDEELS
jgi:predicted ribonuclease YlaK